MKVNDENVFLSHGKEAKAVQVAGRTPLSNKTNNQGRKYHKLSQQGEESSLKLQKKTKNPVFAVFEDSAEAGRTVPVRSPAVSDQQTQTEPPSQPQRSDADRLVADMCSEQEPSGYYWRQLAETRQAALQEALSENQQLLERLRTVEEEARLLRDVVQQAEGVMAAVQEWSEEQNQETGHQ